MTRKTLEDCARCPSVSSCDAHISGGTHKHAEGADPCTFTPRPVITEEPIPNPACFGHMQQCTEILCWDADQCRVETEASQIDAAYEAGRDAGMGVQ